MKTMLVIPDYKFGVDGWEKERSYFNNFSCRAEAKGWKVIHIREQFSIEKIDCVFAPNYAKYLDKVHNFNIYGKIIKNNKIKKITAIFEAPSRRPNLWSYTKWFDFCVSFNKNPEKHCQCKHIESPYPYNFSEFKCNYLGWNSRDTLVWVSSNNWFKGSDSLSPRRLQDFNFLSEKLNGKVALYGKGWDTKNYSLYSFFPIIRTFYNRTNKKYYSNIVQYWLGTVGNKLETISNYKFCFSYENTDDYPGYVTEKVFDAWMAGCIPVYWGNREFEKLYKDLLICPRNLGIEKSVEIMRELDQEKAYRIYSKFKSKLEDGEFTRFSHESFQDKILDTAESLV